MWTTFEPDDARVVFACFDQPDLKAVVRHHRAGARAVAGHEQHRRRRDQHERRREHVGLSPTRPAVDVRPGRQRRPVRRAAQHAQRLRPRSLRASLARADAGARRRGALRPDREGAGVLRRAVRACRSRSRATTRSSHPSSAARWRTTAASPGATRYIYRDPPSYAEREYRARCCCTRWRTCGSATSSPCAGGTTSGSTRRSRSGPARGRPSPAPSSPTCGPACSPPTSRTRTPPTSPRPPTRSARRSSTSRPPRPASTPSPTPRALRSSSSSSPSSARTSS